MNPKHVMPAALTEAWQSVLTALEAVEAAVAASEWTLAGHCNRELHRALEGYDAGLLRARDALDAEAIRVLLTAFENMVARHERCTESLHAARRQLTAEMTSARAGRQGAQRYLEAAGP